MIPIYKPYLPEECKSNLINAIESSWISSLGKYIEEFETKFEQYTKVPYATSVFNGTVALHLALDCLGIGNGDKVGITSFSYVASVHSILYVNAEPIYLDLDKEKILTPCLEQIKYAHEKHKLRAIILTHFYGYPADLNNIVEYCSQNSILIVEDCAEALGSYYKNRHVGISGSCYIFILRK